MFQEEPQKDFKGFCGNFMAAENSHYNKEAVIVFEDFSIGANIEIAGSDDKIDGQTEEGLHEKNFSTNQEFNISQIDLDQVDSTMAGVAKRGTTKDPGRSKPDPRAMRVLLRHLYETTGQIYEDVPQKYRTSHIGLALYLKHCLQRPEMLL